MMRTIFFKFLVFPSYFVKRKLWGVLRYIGMCRPKGYGFCTVLVSKPIFGLNSRMVFEEIWECMDVFVVFIPNE